MNAINVRRLDIPKINPWCNSILKQIESGDVDGVDKWLRCYKQNKLIDAAGKNFHLNNRKRNDVMDTLTYSTTNTCSITWDNTFGGFVHVPQTQSFQKPVQKESEYIPVDRNKWEETLLGGNNGKA